MMLSTTTFVYVITKSAKRPTRAKLNTNAHVERQQSIEKY